VQQLEVQANKEQLRTLACSIAELLQALDQEYRKGQLVSNKIFVFLDDLRTWQVCHIQAAR
jgi:hypothetical protein